MKICVVDLETDPFEYGKMIYPFVAGFYDGEKFVSFWSTDCCERFCKHIESIDEPLVIYAHNGGRFDFFYFLPFLRRDLRIVNNRIIQAWIGKHEFRDSFAIMPFALETYKKTSINYDWFKKGVREKKRDTIISYLRDDCVDLHTLCVAFHQEFGNNLTIGGASMKQLKKFHQFRRGNGEYDSRLRSKYYFGGRNQCFSFGIIHGPCKIFDVNSMYPHVMHDFLHPVSTGIYQSKKIETQTCFVTVEGRNFGAFPIRQKDNSLDFTIGSGQFHTTIHEYEAALETGTFIPKRVLCTYGFSERHNFDSFVSHFYEARKKAKATDDQIRTIFYKYVLNSAYGKFAQNPENYSDWYITPAGGVPPDQHSCLDSCPEDCPLKWTPAFLCENHILWQRPLQDLDHSWYNVATGSSITGAARSVLLRGLSKAIKPYYCDTDSIICEDMRDVPKDALKLGAWKLEAEGDMLAICGKKLYAVYQSLEPHQKPPIDPKTKKPVTTFMHQQRRYYVVKKAHKGVLLTGQEILKIAAGESVTAYNPVPSFKWNGQYNFTHREIKNTYVEP